MYTYLHADLYKSHGDHTHMEYTDTNTNAKYYIHIFMWCLPCGTTVCYICLFICKSSHAAVVGSRRVSNDACLCHTHMEGKERGIPFRRRSSSSLITSRFSKAVSCAASLFSRPCACKTIRFSFQVGDSMDKDASTDAEIFLQS